MIRKFCTEHKYFCSLLFGALNSLPFIFNNLWWLSWFSLVPLFIFVFNFENYAISKKTGYFCISLFFFAYYFGAYSFFSALYPMTFAGIGYVASFFILAFAWLFLSVVYSALMSLSLYTVSILCKNNYFRIFSVILAFVLMEFVFSVGPWGFPWARFSIPQYKNLYLIQSASLFGPYFIDLILLMTNGLLSLIIVSDKNRGKFAIALLVIIVGNLIFGIYNMNSSPKTIAKTDVAIVQGNVLADEKWHQKSSFEVYMDLTTEIDEKTDLVVWSETAIPTELNTSKLLLKRLENYCANTDKEMIVGAFYNGGFGRIYNSAYYINKQGVSDDKYFKRRLVPFGEYLPFRDLLDKVPFLDTINMLSYDLCEGNNADIIKTKNGKVGCLICFDSIFRFLARDSVNNGAQLLVIITNDSWYKNSPAVYLHNGQSVWRAIENGRWVVRAANSGVSSIISPKGKIVSSIPPLVKGTLSEEVSFIEEKTLYSQIGDIIILPVFFVLIIVLFVENKKAFVKQKLN